MKEDFIQAKVRGERQWADQQLKISKLKGEKGLIDNTEEREYVLKELKAAKEGGCVKNYNNR